MQKKLGMCWKSSIGRFPMLVWFSLPETVKWLVKSPTFWWVSNAIIPMTYSRRKLGSQEIFLVASINVLSSFPNPNPKVFYFFQACNTLKAWLKANPRYVVKISTPPPLFAAFRLLTSLFFLFQVSQLSAEWTRRISSQCSVKACDVILDVIWYVQWD